MRILQRSPRRILGPAMLGVLVLSTLVLGPRSLASTDRFQGTVPTPTPLYTIPPGPTETAVPPGRTKTAVPPGPTTTPLLPSPTTSVPPGYTPSLGAGTSTPALTTPGLPAITLLPSPVTPVTPAVGASDVPTASPTPSPELGCRAEVSREDVLPGEEIQYAISLEAAGTGAAGSVIIRDEMAPGIELLQISATQGSVEVQGQLVKLSMGTIEPGQTVLAILGLRVSRSTPAGQVFLQQATADFNGGQSLCTLVVFGTPPDHLPPTGADRRQP
jgi:uncharacterized repeat protein (TIGR01451 family)